MKHKLLTINIKPEKVSLAYQLEKYDTKARLLGCKLVRGYKALLMIEIIHDDNYKKLISSLKNALGKRNVIVVNENDSRSFLITTLKHRAIHDAVSKSKTFCITCPFITPSRPDGYVSWTVLVPSSESAKNFIKILEQRNVEVKSVSSNKIAVNPLTAREFEILRTAYNLGYYDYPRLISFNELAKKLGIVPSTLSEELRKAEKKVITIYMRNLLKPLSITSFHENRFTTSAY
ncbi:MAG: helix-turn-helix domain-containing protein [Thermoprotei archaeon]